MDKADLGTSQALENHALLVMNALDEAITNLDDPEFLIDMLLATGKSHQRFENFSMQIFWVWRHTLSGRVVADIGPVVESGKRPILTGGLPLSFCLSVRW